MAWEGVFLSDGPVLSLGSGLVGFRVVDCNAVFSNEIGGYSFGDMTKSNGVLFFIR